MSNIFTAKPALLVLLFSELILNTKLPNVLWFHQQPYHQLSKWSSPATDLRYVGYTSTHLKYLAYISICEVDFPDVYSTEREHQWVQTLISLDELYMEFRSVGTSQNSGWSLEILPWRPEKHLNVSPISRLARICKPKNRVCLEITGDVEGTENTSGSLSPRTIHLDSGFVHHVHDQEFAPKET